MIREKAHGRDPQRIVTRRNMFATEWQFAKFVIVSLLVSLRTYMRGPLIPHGHGKPLSKEVHALAFPFASKSALFHGLRSWMVCVKSWLPSKRWANRAGNWPSLLAFDPASSTYIYLFGWVPGALWRSLAWWNQSGLLWMKRTSNGGTVEPSISSIYNLFSSFHMSWLSVLKGLEDLQIIQLPTSTISRRVTHGLVRSLLRRWFFDAVQSRCAIYCFFPFAG